MSQDLRGSLSRSRSQSSGQRALTQSENRAIDVGEFQFVEPKPPRYKVLEGFVPGSPVVVGDVTAAASPRFQTISPYIIPNPRTPRHPEFKNDF